jgi:hypothetical protein
LALLAEIKGQGDPSSKEEELVTEAHKEAHMKDGWKVVRKQFSVRFQFRS